MKPTFTIDLTGAWERYAGNLPAGAVALGTVTRDETDTGALVKLATGLYAQCNAGCLRSLGGRTVTALLGAAGRPAEMLDGRRINVYLDSESIEAAKRIGNGNISAGIRAAIRKGE